MYMKYMYTSILPNMCYFKTYIILIFYLIQSKFNEYIIGIIGGLSFGSSNIDILPSNGNTCPTIVFRR